MRHEKCAGPRCRRVATRRGLCGAHAKQVERGKRLAPLRKYRKTVEVKAEPEAPVLYVFPEPPDESAMSDEEFERMLARQS